jgi:hypothetical protein
MYALVVLLPLAASAQDGPTVQSSQVSTPASPPASPSSPPPAASPTPLGISGQIAPWLQIRGEYRARIEGFDGGGFADNNSDAYWLGRFRVSAAIQPTASLSFFVQAQDARAFSKTTGGLIAPMRDTLNLHQAYGDFGTEHVMVRIGRQELIFGEQRLIGNLQWVNAARTFDGGRLTVRRAIGQFDVFAASVVAVQPDGFDKSGNGNALYGTYESLTGIIPKQAIEPYFLWRQSSNVKAELGGTWTIHQATTGVRIAGKLPATFDYSTEIAAQTGSVGPDKIKAWASHALLGKRLDAVPVQTRVFGEFNHASGDANQSDGTRGTFDQLYPTGHDKLGLSDQVGWKNINHARAGAEIKPSARWQLTGSYHSWWLASATDALYSASGAAIVRSPTGSAGRHVGQELDGVVTYVYSPQFQVNGGLAHIFPGEFLTNTTAGHAYTYPYVMVTYVFIGDRPNRAAGASR